MNPSKKLVFRILIFVSILCFVFILFAVNTELIYDHQQIAWESSPEFFNYYFSFAGGPAEYITLFIAQFFYKNWLGSIIVAFIIFLISYLLINNVTRKFRGYSISYFLVPLISVVLAALMTDYNYYFSITVNLLLVTLILFLIDLVENKFSLQISFDIIIAGILVYYLNGGIYFLIFMFVSLVLALKKLKGKVIVNLLMIIVTAILLPYLANKFVFLTSMKMSYFRAYPEVAVMLRYSRPVLFYVILGSITFLFALNAIISLILNNRIAGTKENSEANKKQFKLFGRISSQTVLSVFLIFIWVLISTTILYRSYSSANKIKNEIDYQAHLGNWDKVIDLSHQIEDYDRMVNFQYNRALLHEDKLLDDLFSYQQILGVQGLFLDRPFAAEVALPNSDLYFDLGNINESQRLAFEALIVMPRSPCVLERLAQNYIIEGKIKSAETFLNALCFNPLEKSWAERMRLLISSNSSISNDPLISEKIKYMDTAGVFGESPRSKLISLLHQNKNNKFAFEYLIAFDLMEHDLNSFSEDIKYISNLNYSKLPKIVEEAVVLFVSQRPDNDFLKSFRISSETIERFREFASITRSNRGNLEKAKQAAIDYSDTYWYYVLFLSPLVTSVKLDTRSADAYY